jgi:hypothetical protein
MLAVKSKQCATKKNKYHCPEIFLDAVADKLTTTADLFLDAELLSKFYYIVCLLPFPFPYFPSSSTCHFWYDGCLHFWLTQQQFPRELDARLGRNLSQEEVDRFAKEDPKIKRHLDVVRRKDLLEHVLKEMEGLRQLEQREKRMMGRGERSESLRGERGGRKKERGWNMF